MAKITMVCPFSKELCKDCPLYRGRHYYYCFDSKYRGYLGNQKEAKEQTVLRGVKNFEMPLHLTPSPSWLTINELIERKYYNTNKQT